MGITRAQQALELIMTHPGMTIADLAQEMGMRNNYPYKVLPRLEKEGKIKKEGAGYRAAGPRAAVPS